jgi:hypothetical protein
LIDRANVQDMQGITVHVAALVDVNCPAPTTGAATPSTSCSPASRGRPDLKCLLNTRRLDDAYLPRGWGHLVSAWAGWVIDA